MMNWTFSESFWGVLFRLCKQPTTWHRSTCILQEKPSGHARDHCFLAAVTTMNWSTNHQLVGPTHSWTLELRLVQSISSLAQPAWVGFMPHLPTCLNLLEDLRAFEGFSGYLRHQAVTIQAPDRKQVLDRREIQAGHGKTPKSYGLSSFFSLPSSSNVAGNCSINEGLICK